MKAYQLLQQGTGKQVLLMAPADWKVVKSKGLEGFYELHDSKGKHAILLREFDIQELPAVQAAEAPKGKAQST